MITLSNISFVALEQAIKDCKKIDWASEEIELSSEVVKPKAGDVEIVVHYIAKKDQFVGLEVSKTSTKFFCKGTFVEVVGNCFQRVLEFRVAGITVTNDGSITPNWVAHGAEKAQG